MLCLLVTDLANNKVPLEQMTCESCYPMALVILPTRELAVQVAADGQLLADGIISGLCH